MLKSLFIFATVGGGGNGEWQFALINTRQYLCLVFLFVFVCFLFFENCFLFLFLAIDNH